MSIFCLFVCVNRNMPYICNVFFMVLDLRLTKIGCRDDNHFFISTFQFVKIKKNSFIACLNFPIAKNYSVLFAFSFSLFPFEQKYPEIVFCYRGRQIGMFA